MNALQHLAAPRLRPQKAQPRNRALRLVGPVSSRARKAPFVVVVLAMVGMGLVGLILMSTVLQAQSFEVASLNQQVDALETRQQALSREVHQLQSPSYLASRALLFGMVPNANPVFLRLSDGEVVGKARPAVPRSNFKQVTR
jgi:cell division protein FtsB